MDVKKLAEEIIAGRRLTRQDDLSFFLTCDLKELQEGADLIRKHFCGDKVDLCTIINGKSGRCGENCKYCAQSAHNKTGIEEYPFLCKDKIVNEALANESDGVDRFAIVTAGRGLVGEDFEKAIDSYKTMKNDGEEAFKGGASATITGNMLTTSGSTIASDKALLTSLGRDIVPEYLR